MTNGHQLDIMTGALAISKRGPKTDRYGQFHSIYSIRLHIELIRYGTYCHAK